VETGGGVAARAVVGVDDVGLFAGGGMEAGIAFEGGDWTGSDVETGTRGVLGAGGFSKTEDVSEVCSNFRESEEITVEGWVVGGGTIEVESCDVDQALPSTLVVGLVSDVRVVAMVGVATTPSTVLTTEG
jgi:hypothetical protein